MTLLELIFWISTLILFYCYAGYGIILFLVNKFRKPSSRLPIPETFPSVTLIVPAYNEQLILDQKISNCLNLDYPPDKIKIIVITDGSTDNSGLIAETRNQVLHLHQQPRMGKMAAIKRAMQYVDTPFVIFTDANTLLNKDCIRKMMIHYNHPYTGGVAGEKKILQGRGISGVGQAEGLYWKYESWLKKQDAEFYTVVGAAGELFSIRTALYQQLDDTIILDDFLISMKVCLKGYRIGYEPGAYATESPSLSLSEEKKRKIRISAGAYQSITYLGECLNLFRHPILGLQYISRRLLRWIFCPLLLIIALLTNIFLFLNNAGSIYTWILLAQVVFYLSAIPGAFIVVNGKKAGILSIPFYFVFMNYCLVQGFIKYINRSQSVVWEKSVRQSMNVLVD